MPDGEKKQENAAKQEASQDQSQASEPATENQQIEAHEINSGNPNSYLIAMGLAVLFAIALIAFGIMAFGEDKTQDSAIETPSSNEALDLPLNTQSTETEEVDLTQPVTGEGLDKDIEEIDSVLEEMDESDFNSSELSEEALEI